MRKGTTSSKKKSVGFESESETIRALRREIEIEAALERVRASSMAMHKSDELLEVVRTLDKEIIGLGIDINGTQILTDFTKEGVNSWYAREGQAYLEKIYVPYVSRPLLSKLKEAWKSNLGFFVEKYSKAEKNRFLKWLYKHTKYGNFTTQQRRKFVFSTPGWSRATVLSKNSALVFQHFDLKDFTKEEVDIFKRFAKVFEQAYARFLDLRKAEAQAREAQIEVALERVRAASMAMHKSEELAKVVAILNQEVAGLGIVVDGSDLVTGFSQPEKGIDTWLARSGRELLDKFHIPYLDHPLTTTFYNNLKKGVSYYTDKYSKSERNKYFRLLFKYSDFRRIPRERQQYYLNMPGWTRALVISKNSIFIFHRFLITDFTVEEEAILKRFGNVFEQSYTRFLDLQKAETQAREAEIQLALERVRSAAMAMHSSDELSHTITVLFEQLNILGINPINTYLVLYDLAKNQFSYRMTGKRGSELPEMMTFSFDKLPGFKPALQSWKAREPVIEAEYLGNDRKKWLNLIKPMNSRLTKEDRLSLKDFPNGVFSCSGRHEFGSLGILKEKKATGEEKGLLVRFAKEFNQAYTRFLDLQKAEAQAREAQIEAALERVRAASMAMHKSQELQVVIQVVCEQLLSLGISLDSTLFTHVLEDGSWDTWTATPTQTYPAQIYVPYIKTPNMALVNKAYVQGDNELSFINSKKEKNEFLRHFYKNTTARDIPAARKKYALGGKAWALSFFFMKDIVLGVTNYAGIPFSEEELAIFRRFKNAFEQAYTRFLDLQKAETQAREAQIEAALERIRSRALAMHHSEEIEDVVYVMKEQMSLLGQPGLHASIIHLWPKDSNYIESWSAYDYEKGRKKKSSFLRSTIPKGTSRLFKRMEKFYASAEQEGAIVANHEELKEWYKVRLKLFPETRKIGKAPKIMYYRMSKFSEGYLLLASNEPAGEETISLQNRAAKVFDLAYRRYVDLKNAEAQAREAQIEAALEKVRSRSLALQKSDELREVVAVLLQQMQIIGIDAFMSMIVLLNRKTEEYDVIMSSDVQSVLPKIYRVPNFKDTFRKRFIKSFSEGKAYKVFEFGGKLKKDFDKLFFKVTDFSKLPAKSKRMMQSLERCSLSCAYMSHGCIEAIGDQPLSAEDANILQRFARVFEQAYTRFLDIKNAEAQAREAQIEAALERVRSKAMAMHNSADLPSAASVVFTELRALGLNPFRSGISLHSREHREILLYTATQSKKGDELSVVGTAVLDNHPVLTKVYDKWLAGEDYYPSLKGKLLKSYYVQIAPTFKVPKEQSEIEQYGYFIPFTQGLLYGWATQPVDESQKQILKRFASVVDLTFKRYFDLEKAEAQAREAQVEAALERVRAKAMGMHNTADLSTAASTVFSELRKLGIEPIRSGVGHLHKESPMSQLYAATSSVSGDELSLVGQINLVGHPVLEEIYDSWMNEKDYFPELNGSQLRVYYKLLAKEIPIPVGDFRKDDKQYGHFIYAPIGFLYVWSEEKYNDEQIRILKRFASIIDLTFRRYFELQKSEANAKEAIKRSVLDRIRADIASMRSVTDLDRITPLIWNELTTLGIPFVRCGAFIMDESQKLIHTFLSTPEGKAIAAFHLPYEVAGKTRLILENWQMNKAYVDHWTDSDFLDFANMLVGQHIIESSDQYLSTVPRGGVHLHCLPFLQGMLYVGSTQRLSDEDISLIQSIADAFSTAYARYEDFNKLEAAKHQVENTLTDLKQAQQQLVQSEKMASLGELTAGIAHEIQNPLNFVNNFSEVSTELLEEMKSELDSGNWQPATELANDIMTNLEKILHHGKRADGIVKGMLQHSRGSTGQRESTDINNLCDEYLRLAFHGYRAKDKSFNAKFETKLDATLPKVNVVPQDIGRVVLNLINNAFYAVSVRVQGVSSRTYQPLVIVATRNLGDKIEIRVRDNGGGIPESVREKIFQPFYTTKPTGQGTGLGLSLSYDIIKSHKGEIRFESVDGEGTEFIINIPIA